MFHDTLNAFVNKVFELDHKEAFEAREKRIADAMALGKLDTLPYYDRIEQASKEYWYLGIGEQEVVLEKSDPSF